MKPAYNNYFSLSNQANAFAIKIRLLNNFGNFVPLNSRNISMVLGVDDFSISKGADANDMLKMDSMATKKSVMAAFVVGAVDGLKIANIYNGINKKIINHEEYKKVTFPRPALFIAVIQRNKQDSNIARLDEVLFIERATQQKIKDKAKKMKKNNQMCLHGKISCMTKISRVNKSVYYENLFLVVGRE